MSSILKVDQLQDSGGNEIITSNGSGTITVNSQPFKNGITMADQFRLTVNLTGDQDPISSLERVDESYFAKIGTGMTESSGIFSFPSTGLYLIMFQANNQIVSDTAGFGFKVSTDSGSTYDAYAQANTRIASGTVEKTEFLNGFVNVTDISTFRVKFTTNSFTGNTILGATTQNKTVMTFIRLGDSV